MAGASTSNPDQFVIPDKLLTLDNYESWRDVMCRNLEWHDLWSYLTFYHDVGIFDLRKDKEALEAIKMACSGEMLPHIMYAGFAREAWDCLAEAGAWTDLEREDYNDRLATATTARAISNDFPEVDKILTRRNYYKWKIYMKNVLLSQYLWTVVDGSDLIRSKSYEIKNHTASVIIRMSCGEEIYAYIDEEDNARDAWCLLEAELGAPGSDMDSNEIIIDYELLTVTIDDEHHTSSSNYETWEVCMKDYLINNGMWGFLEEPEILDCVQDEKALDAIKASCALEIRAYILYMNCARNAWEKLAIAAATSTESEVALHIDHLIMVNEGAEIRAKLVEDSKADKVLTRSNYQEWEEHVTMLLRSRLLYDVVLPLDHESFRGLFNDYEIKEACALRIIKEACGPEMMRYVWRSKYPEEALNSLSKACSTEQKGKYMQYSQLLHAIHKYGFREHITDHNGELWRGAHKFFRDFPEALVAEIMEDGSTALHVAVMLGRVDFLRELLQLMTAAQLESKTHQGNTAIVVAAGGNNLEIVKMLVTRNPNLLLIGNQLEHNAVAIAAINGNEMIMRYLYFHTVNSTLRWGTKSITSLITSAARLDAFDIVSDLLRRFSADYALRRDDYKMTLLDVLTEKPSAFPSGNQFGLFRGLIYRLAGTMTFRIILENLKIIVPGVKKVLDNKEKHDDTAVILQKICSLLSNLNHEELKNSLTYEAIEQATIHGIIEIFECLINTNLYLQHFKDENGRGLLQIAIINRQESIFRYICMGLRNQNMTLLDKNGNNALHCAALWDPSSQLVHGPALKMQRELQWFLEVERVVPPTYKDMRNKDKVTPKILFTEQHKELTKEAEKWMKEMANACIIVTALIATVMFAAPFTLPGGTDQNTGVSLTLQSRAFKVFIVSDVISLFASCTSLLMFFSILTARYAERDFLTSLPRRLILGLFTLFFAIATMMVTFSATIIIVLRGEAHSRAYIWVSLLACIPVVVFALLQFRLFGNLVLSTYGRGVFRSKRMVFAPLISVGYG